MELHTQSETRNSNTQAALQQAVPDDALDRRSWGSLDTATLNFCEVHHLDSRRIWIWICCRCLQQYRHNTRLTPSRDGMFFKNVATGVGQLITLMAPWRLPSLVPCLTPAMAQESKYIRYAKYLNEIGKSLYRNGQSEGGLDQFQKCLAIRESVLDPNDPSTAVSHNNIGFLLKEKGDYDASLEHYQKYLAIRVSALGEGHEDTTTTYNDIARVLNRQGDLAAALHSKGDYDGALEQYQKCLAVTESVFGRNHRTSASIHNNIGTLLGRKGDYKGALDQFQRCLAVKKTRFGDAHPSTAATYQNIGGVLMAKGDYIGALEHCQKCLAIRQSVLGKVHPDTAATHQNIGSVLYSSGEYQGALYHYRKCLTIFELVFGKDHPHARSCKPFIKSLKKRTHRANRATCPQAA